MPNMKTEHEIESAKLFVKEIFSQTGAKWFRIPEYQRHYIWSKDEINDLLDDLRFAFMNKPDQEYFLGSFVCQNKKVRLGNGQEYVESDLLDGQQRMTTLLMLVACIRDLCDSQKLKRTCQALIFQEGDEFMNIPERARIVYAIREEVTKFVENYVILAEGTKKVEKLEELTKSENDPSIPNMAKALMEMRQVLSSNEQPIDLKKFSHFLFNKVLLVYVGTGDFDDAFRLFTILNNRGVPLRNSDILKSLNLGALDKDADKIRYAQLWEEAEGELGDDFDRFLNHIRTILVKEKARLNLMVEFEQKIYNPRDGVTGKVKPPLLNKGKETFEFVERYLNHYSTLISGKNDNYLGNRFAFDNLVHVMSNGLPSTDWIPPLMRYFDKFGYDCLHEFLKKLDNKFSADWISQKTPTTRIENMTKVINKIDEANSSNDVFKDDLFEIDDDAFNRSIEAAVYGKRFTRYLLRKLDFLFSDDSHLMTANQLSVEHILPQNPKNGSQWKLDFTDEEREDWTNKLGNLVLISTRKNTSQGRKDYIEKKQNYFKNWISPCPNSLRIMQDNDQWTLAELKANHTFVLKKLRDHYGIY